MPGKKKNMIATPGKTNQKVWEDYAKLSPSVLGSFLFQLLPYFSYPEHSEGHTTYRGFFFADLMTRFSDNRFHKNCDLEGYKIIYKTP